MLRWLKAGASAVYSNYDVAWQRGTRIRSRPSAAPQTQPSRFRISVDVVRRYWCWLSRHVGGRLRRLRRSETSSWQCERCSVAAGQPQKFISSRGSLTLKTAFTELRIPQVTQNITPSISIVPPARRKKCSQESKMGSSSEHGVNIISILQT
jgi:hypothetical protein